MKKLIILLPLVSLVILHSPKKCLGSEKLFKVIKNHPSADRRAFAMVDTVTGQDRIVEIDLSGEVVWEWKFPVELKDERKRLICRGADIKYFPKTDSFLFNIPYKGAYFLNREGVDRKVVEDNQIDHDVDLLSNGNFLYARGFVDKGEDQVREVTPSGKKNGSGGQKIIFPIASYLPPPFRKEPKKDI